MNRVAPIVIALACLADAGAAATRRSLGDLPTVTVALKDDVIVDQPQVRLGDVLRMRGPVPTALQRALAMPIVRLPSDGEPISLSRAQVERRLRDRLGATSQAVEWTGSDSARVRLRTVVVSGDRIAGAARNQVGALLESCGSRAGVEVVRAPVDIVAPAGKLNLKVRAPAWNQAADRTGSADSPGRYAGLKRQSVWVDAWVGDRLVRTVDVVMEMGACAMPPDMSRDAVEEGPARGDASMMDNSDVDASPKGQAVRQLSTFDPVPGNAGTTGNPAIGGGRARTAAWLGSQSGTAAPGALPPRGSTAHALVSRGDVATLVAHQGAIRVESRVEVLQDGVADQEVRVKLPNAGTSIVARVTGPGQVEVNQ